MSKRKLKRLDKKEERGNTIRVQEESAGVKTRIVGKEAGIQASSGKTYFAPCIILIMIALIIFMGYMKYQQALWNSDPHESEFARHGDDHYETLGLDSTASRADIIAAKRRLTRILHPDKNKGCEDCKDKFERMQRAYEVLISEEQRYIYNERTGRISSLRSRTEELTYENYNRQVKDSNEIWIIQIYDPTNKRCEQIAGFWDGLYDDMKHLMKFGRINRQTQETLLGELSLNTVIVPTVIALVPGKSPENMDLRQVLSPSDMRQIAENMMTSMITQVTEMNHKEFFGIDDDSRISPLLPHEVAPENKFSFLLLGKQRLPSIVYKKLALMYHKNIYFGNAAPLYKRQILQNLQQPKGSNIVVSYQKVRNTREKKSENRTRNVVKETLGIAGRKGTLPQIIDSVLRHSVVDIYENNYKVFCTDETSPLVTQELIGSKETISTESVIHTEDPNDSANDGMGDENYNDDDDEDAPVVNDGKRVKVCALELVDSEYSKTDEYVKKKDVLQNYILQQGKSELRKLEATRVKNNFVIQYGKIDLSFHPELRKFLNELVTFDLEANQQNFLILTDFNQAFTIFSANKEEDLDYHFSEASEEDNDLKKDYFTNYKKRFSEYLSREEDTFIQTLYQLFKTKFTFWNIVLCLIMAFIAFKVAEHFKLKFVTFAKTFGFILGCEIIIPAVIYFYTNREHYFS